MARQSLWSRLWHGRAPVPPPTDEPAPPPVRDETLETEISSAPDSVEPYLAYGKWLQERGDPRGMLISLQAQCATRVDQQRPNGPVRTLEPWRELAGEHAEAARAVIARFPNRLGGDLDVDDHAEWHCGYWRRLRVKPPDVESATQSLKSRLAAVLGHDSSRFLRTLSIGLAEPRPLARYFPQLPATVRCLHLGEPAFPDDPNLEHFGFGPVAPLLDRAPGLEQLVLQGPSLELGDRMQLPRLRSLELVTTRLSGTAVLAIATSDLPALETLILWIGDKAAEPEHLRALIAAPMPALRELALVSCPFTDEVLADLLAAPWFPQLRALDLSNGALGVHGVTVLEEARDRLANLERLDISGSSLDGDAVARVTALARGVQA